MDKMRMESVDITDQNIDKISELFPSCITETMGENGKLKKAINFDMLRQLLSKDVSEGDEVYDFTWVGKKAALREANTPIRKTLRPEKERSVNWNTTENLYIEGDNLEALKLLQESYLGKVKMIYIDPPYNTGNDFIYNDDFKMNSDEYAEESGEIDEDGDRMVKNTDSNGRFHSDWCSMIYPRLMLARNLLTDDGVIFISIDDNEQENLKKICDEVFGAGNFVQNFVWHKKTQPSFLSKEVANVTEYILCYRRKTQLELFGGYTDADKPIELINISNSVSTRKFRPGSTVFGNNYTGSIKAGMYGNAALSIELLNDITVSNGVPSTEFLLRGKFRWTQEKINTEINDGAIINIKSISSLRPTVKRTSGFAGVKPPISLLSKYVNQLPTNTDASNEAKRLFNGVSLMSFPKPSELIKYLANAVSINSKTSIILDFFSGSATTAHAVMQLNAEDGGNRKFIMVQLPEKCDEKSEAFKAGYKNICEIGEERIRRAAKKIHEDNPDAKFDDGFRVFRIDDSSMTDIYYSAEQYNQNMLANLESNIKPDRTDLDLLFGCLLEWGLPLSMPHTSEDINGFHVHTYNDGDLIACFDENISEETIKTIASRKPLRAVFRDSSFIDSPSKINVAEIFKMQSPDTTIKVI